MAKLFQKLLQKYFTYAKKQPKVSTDKYSKCIIDCKGSVILYFCGSPNPLGQSWSLNCNRSGPVVHSALKTNETKNFHFVHVGIGTYNEWKDPYCPFKTHEKLQLRNLPTLIFWRHSERLTGKECIDEDKVRAFIERLP